MTAPLRLVGPSALVLLVSFGSPAGAQGPGAGGAEAVAVPAGSYLPLFVQPDGVGEVRVERFRMDPHPVTLAAFAAFLRAEPRWRRDRTPPALSGPAYLADWRAPDHPGVEGDALLRPVTHVSWFAARAYCAWVGGRLPTTDEWEWAASFDDTGRPSWSDPAFHARTLAALQSRPPVHLRPPVASGSPNGLGLYDLHDLVWEWTEDFNNQMLSGAGRDDRGLDRQLFCAAGSAGATDLTNYAGFLRYGFRATLGGGAGAPGLGFRCAY